MFHQKKKWIRSLPRDARVREARRFNEEYVHFHKENWPSEFSLDHHEHIYCIGDTHGDLQALLRACALTTCVRTPDSILTKASKCHTDDAKANLDGDLGAVQSSRIGNPLTDDELQQVQWVGGSNLIVFLGDVLDNRRQASDDVWGVCAKSGTQYQMMQLIVHLKQQARAQSGDVVWVLGNHDVSNAIELHDLDCRNYAPRAQSMEDGRLMRVCNKKDGTFDPAYQTQVRKIMQRAKVIALGSIAHRSGNILLLHGGLSRVNNTIFPDIVRGQHRENLHAVNKLFHDALVKHTPRSIENIRKHLKYMPTWCRPKQLDNLDELKSYFGATRMVKAHDRQRHAHCVDKEGRESRGDDAELADGDLCKIDVGMSRAFHHHKEGSQPRFSVLHVFVGENGTVRRQIVTA